MKIAIRGGHNPQCPGANGIINEVTENRKIYPSVIKWLKIDKNEVIDVTPYNCNSSEDLKRGVNDANARNVDIFASIHLNAGGGHGTEVLYYDSSTLGKILANRVCNSIADLGFTNRGAKSDVRGLYELKYTEMPAIIIECLFVDSAADVVLYNKLGIDVLGKAIAEGIVGHAITEIKPTIIVPSINYVLETQKFLNNLNITDYENKRLDEDGFIGDKTLSALEKLKTKF